MVQFKKIEENCSIMQYTYTKNIILKVIKLNLNKIIDFDNVSIMPTFKIVIEKGKDRVVAPKYRYKEQYLH